MFCFISGKQNLSLCVLISHCIVDFDCCQYTVNVISFCSDIFLSTESLKCNRPLNCCCSCCCMHSVYNRTKYFTNFVHSAVTTCCIGNYFGRKQNSVKYSVWQCSHAPLRELIQNWTLNLVIFVQTGYCWWLFVRKWAGWTDACVIVHCYIKDMLCYLVVWLKITKLQSLGLNAHKWNVAVYFCYVIVGCLDTCSNGNVQFIVSSFSHWAAESGFVQQKCVLLYTFFPQKTMII